MNKLFLALCSLSLSLFAATATCQDVVKSPAGKETKSFQAPISCTSGVPAALCKIAAEEFGMLQKASSVLGDVEIVLADEVAFKKENDRLADRHQRAMQSSAKANDTRGFFGLMTRTPLAPSGLDGAVLFVLEDHGLRKINKVIVSSELFRAGGAEMEGKKEYDLSSVSVWSKYVVGYAEGWFWGRMQLLSEQSGEPPK